MGREPRLNGPFTSGSGTWDYLWAMRMLLVILLLTGIVGLFDTTPAYPQSDQKSARDAADAGKIRPLSEILRTVKSSVPGQVLDIQLDKSTTPWTYRIRIRGEQGNVVLVVVDAESGRILSTKGGR